MKYAASILLVLFLVASACGSDSPDDHCYTETPSGLVEVACAPEARAKLVTSCTLPTPATVAPVVLVYRPGLSIDVYSPAAPVGSWIVVWHGGGGTSTSATKRDANVVALCEAAVSMGITCYAPDYDPATATTPVGLGFREALCALRFASADATAAGLNPARGGVAGISWGGTLASFTAAALRAGWTVPGGLGTMMPGGVDLTDPGCPTAPLASDATIVKAAALWYSPVDWRSWTLLNNNGAVGNHGLEIDAGATFGSAPYIGHSGDMSAITLPHSTATTGILWALAQGTLSGVDGDGFVKLSTQASAFDSPDTVTAPSCNHNFSPVIGNTPGGCQALAANCNNLARIGAL